MLDLIARWDLDKTYLRSDFYTLADLMRSLFERADQKRPVPGAARLLGELASPTARIHVLSGSPEQLRRKIEQRLALDGVRIDELTLKPNLQNLARLRWSALRDQLGYKLTALLEVKARELRTLEAARASEVLFGDDSEADAFVYSVYADVCSGAVRVERLAQILEAGHTPADLRARALGAAEQVGRAACCAPELILIHLDRQTPPSRFAGFGPRLVPFFNYAQAALVLLDRALVRPTAFYGVALELVEQHRFDVEALARSFWDLRRRGHVGPDVVTRLGDAAAAPREFAALFERLTAGAPVETRTSSPPPPAPPDYLALASSHRGGRDRR
jgi:hypothetical protein